MTLLERRVRAGLEAEARAIASVAPAAPRRRKAQSSGAGIALVAAALVFVIFGGAAILTRGDEGQVSRSTTSSSVPSSVTSVPSVNPEGPFEAVAFAGESWQFTVAEKLNPSLGTYEVCFGLNPVGGTTDATAFGPPWCADWPKSDPRIEPYLSGVHYGLLGDTSVVLVVELDDQPVDRVTIAGEGIDETITPFALPGSGKQFAVVEVPQTAGMLTVEAVDQAGMVLAQQDGLCGGDRFQRGAELCPDMEGTMLEGVTPVNDSSVARVATTMGGERLSDEKLETIAGSFAQSGYLIESITSSDGSYELGLIVYREQSAPMAPSLICFSEFAITKGVTVGGGATCADNQEKAEELASFHLSMSGSCGGIPKEEPVVDGIWTTLAVWGIPETAETVTVGLADGTTVEVDATNGVALHLWEESVDITSIVFADMTREQRDLISSYMPAEGIGSDCGRGDTGGG